MSVLKIYNVFNGTVYQEIPCEIADDGTITIPSFTIPSCVDGAEIIYEDILDAEILDIP